MDALSALTPDGVLFMIEGTGQNHIGLNWGNGFVTDRATLEARPEMSDANPFFRALAVKSYRNRVIFTPHCYPPSITLRTILGKELWDMSTVSFGYLNKQGYCVNGKCQRYPIVIGEMGSELAKPEDLQWFGDFAMYLQNKGGANDGKHNVISSWLWWAYNENSGDTGGIVYNNWQDIHWEKLELLFSKFFLRPWYLWSTTRVARSA